MTLEEIKREIRTREFADWMYQIANHNRTSEQKQIVDKNRQRLEELYRLKKELDKSAKA